MPQSEGPSSNPPHLRNRRNNRRAAFALIESGKLRQVWIKTEEEVNREERPLRVQQCERCRTADPPTNRFCSKCGTPLDIKTALEIQREQDTTDQIMNLLFQDRRFREALEEVLQRQQSLQTQ